MQEQSMFCSSTLKWGTNCFCRYKTSVEDKNTTLLTLTKPSSLLGQNAHIVGESIYSAIVISEDRLGLTYSPKNHPLYLSEAKESRLSKDKWKT